MPRRLDIPIVGPEAETAILYQLMNCHYTESPVLATGTVVPPRAGEFAAILGDNNRDTEIVSPIPAMKQAFKEAIEEMGGVGGNNTLRADLIIDGTKFGQLVYKFNNQEKQRVGVRMVVEGQA